MLEPWDSRDGAAATSVGRACGKRGADDPLIQHRLPFPIDRAFGSVASACHVRLRDFRREQAALRAHHWPAESGGKLSIHLQELDQARTPAPEEVAHPILFKSR